MALALIVIGLALISSGVQNTQAQLTALLAADFTGAGSFWYYILGISAAGAVGYYQPLQGTSRLLILLLLLVLLLDNNGFFSALSSAVANPVAATPTPAPVTTGVAATASSVLAPSGIITGNGGASAPLGLGVGAIGGF